MHIEEKRGCRVCFCYVGASAAAAAAAAEPCLVMVHPQHCYSLAQFGLQAAVFLHSLLVCLLNLPNLVFSRGGCLCGVGTTVVSAMLNLHSRLDGADAAALSKKRSCLHTLFAVSLRRAFS